MPIIKLPLHDSFMMACLAEIKQAYLCLAALRHCHLKYELSSPLEESFDTITFLGVGRFVVLIEKLKFKN